MAVDWSKVSCFLGCPHYGSFAPATVAGIYLASQRFHPLVHFSGASLLAYNFNILWTQALNLKRTRRIDFYAMLHSDVGPDPGWLDVLIEEMDRVGADVISAILPIKDGRGLTTTGIHDPLDKGMPPKTRRLTLREIDRFPETFDAAGAGFPGQWLALNTGCWVARLDRPWVEDFPGFTILDGIAKLPGGTRMPLVFSEDWHASRWWNQREVKLFATRKVKLVHASNNATYANHPAWGEWETDQGDLPGLAQEGEIEGWMSPEELAWLKEKAAAAPAGAVEVGCWHGRTTRALAESCPGPVFAVDHFQGSPGDSSPVLANATRNGEGKRARTAFLENLKAALLVGKVELFELESGEAAASLDRQRARVDLILLDGNHGYEMVKRDIRIWKPLLRPTGILCGHDRNLPGVRRALDELLPGWKPGAGTLWEYLVEA